MHDKNKFYVLLCTPNPYNLVINKRAGDKESCRQESNSPSLMGSYMTCC